MNNTVQHLTAKRFDGYVAVRLPSELDDVVSAVVAGYRAASPERRREIADSVPSRAAGVLSAFGRRAAAMAVRTGSVRWLRDGLVAMGLAESRLNDPRNNLITLAAVNHSAELLGTDLAVLVGELGGELPAGAAQSFRDFAARQPQHKSLKSMGLRIWGEGDSFTYV